METYRIARGEQIELHFSSHEDAAWFLNHLHDYHDLSWPKIAQLPSINPPGEEPIPISTLANIAETGIVPKKWRPRFPGVKAIDKRQRISISKNEMQKAKLTIINNLEPKKALELTILLQEHFKHELSRKQKR